LGIARKFAKTGKSLINEKRGSPRVRLPIKGKGYSLGKLRSGGKGGKGKSAIPGDGKKRGKRGPVIDGKKNHKMKEEEGSKSGRRLKKHLRLIHEEGGGNCSMERL